MSRGERIGGGGEIPPPYPLSLFPLHPHIVLESYKINGGIMKKRILALLCSAVLFLPALSGCAQTETADTKAPEETTAKQSDKPELTHVTLNEVAHSIFYAPMYVAIEEELF